MLFNTICNFVPKTFISYIKISFHVFHWTAKNSLKNWHLCITWSSRERQTSSLVNTRWNVPRCHSDLNTSVQPTSVQLECEHNDSHGSQWLTGPRLVTYPPSLLSKLFHFQGFCFIFVSLDKYTVQSNHGIKAKHSGHENSKSRLGLLMS